MCAVGLDNDNELIVRDLTIDDFADVFHLGEQLFTADYSPSMYRTWDEYEITTLYNSDTELCLVAELADIGCELKDWETGLVDFPARMSGEEVLLCWKLGEPRVAYWHHVHAGFAGRSPISENDDLA